MNRSFLFVPADSERKLSKATATGADALILDLEDSVALAAKPAAREQAAAFLGEHDSAWVRINPLDSTMAAADLEAIVVTGLAGIVLPKARHVEDVQQLAARLDALEADRGLPAGEIQIMSLCTERPAALLQLQSYAAAPPRLSAMSWGAEDLSAALGAQRNRDAQGNWLPVFELARSLCLLAAAAAETVAVDTVFTDFKDRDGLARYAANARRDGFRGMLAIHPAQVETINRAFVPSQEEIEQAEEIVALFAANPGAGTLGWRGAMVDRPHLVQAQQLLATAAKLATR